MRSLSSLAPLAATAVLSISGGARPGAPRGLDGAERAALSACESAPLRELRAGSAPAGPVLEDERAALRAAEARADGLAALRGSGITLSDRDVQLILITAAVVILLILIF